MDFYTQLLSHILETMASLSILGKSFKNQIQKLPIAKRAENPAFGEALVQNLMYKALEDEVIVPGFVPQNFPSRFDLALAPSLTSTPFV